MKPKILIIGNKEIDFQLSPKKLEFINSFDIIIRINRMNNFDATGQRVDWWWLDHNIKHYKFDKSLVGGVKRLILNWSSVSVFGLINNDPSEDLSKMKMIFPNLPDDCEIVKNPNYHNCSICERTKYWVATPQLKNVPTTFIICLSHIVDEYADTHDIYFTCTDLEGRGELYKTNPNWSKTWHANVGEYEENYLKMLMATNKIKYLDLESNKIKLYCLTLENSIRHKHMQEQLSGIDNIDYEFIFGKHFERDFVEQVIKNKKDKCWRISMFSKQPTYLQKAYSCAEGHRRIMETFLNQNEYEWCLVIEDDCKLPKTIAENVNYIIDTFDQDWYHLATEAFMNCLKKIKTVYTGNPILSIETSNNGRTTMSYIVNKKFAMKYYNDLCPITAPSDMTLWINNELTPIIRNINICYTDDQKHSLIGNND